jgi:hypothetical protein
MGIIMFGFIIMRQIDNFIEDGGLGDNTQTPPKNGILLFGEQTFIRDISSRLSVKNILYYIINEPDISENFNFSIIIAISDNDIDNLLLCNKAKHICPDVLTITRCNDLIYKNVFEDVGINYILTGPLTSDDVLLVVERCELR